MKKPHLHSSTRIIFCFLVGLTSLIPITLVINPATIALSAPTHHFAMQREAGIVRFLWRD
jgi:hypothetical protein